MTFSIEPFDRNAAPLSGALASVARKSAALSALAMRWTQAFRIHSQAAPGFVFVGAAIRLDPEEADAFGMPVLSAAGNGGDLVTAVTGCLGETADLLSQIERPGDVERRSGGIWRTGWFRDVLGSAEPDATGARLGATETTVFLPADLVFRRQPAVRRLDPVGPLSAGCAAGADGEVATLRAILELIERDAVALWWLGGKPPAALPADDPASRAAGEVLSAYRAGAAGRRTLLLDLTTDLGIASIAACSTDEDGRNLACGFAARLDPAEAARAAIGEMCQMELAAPVAAAKRAANGENALTAADRNHLVRASFDTTRCALFRPARESRPTEAIEGGAAALIRHLDHCGVDVAMVDLTRPEIGIDVRRAVAPALQPLAGSVLTPRLRLVRACHGDAERQTGDTPLM